MKKLFILFLLIHFTCSAQVEVMNLEQYELKNGVVDLATIRKLRGRSTTYGQWNGPSRNKIWQSLKVFALQRDLDFEEYNSDLQLNISVELGSDGFIKSILYMTRETVMGESEDSYRVRYDDNYPGHLESKLRTILYAFAEQYRMNSISLNSEFYPLSYRLKPTEPKREAGVFYSIAEAMAASPETVKKIDLSSQKLRDFPEEIFDLTYLEELDVSRNLLEELPRKLWKMKHLTHVNVSRNLLGNKSFHFRKNNTLVSVNMQYNSMDQLPAHIHRLRNLSDLLIGNNFLTNLEQQDFRPMPALKSINLYNAELLKYPQGLEQFENLEELDLYYNALNFIPPSIAKLQKLKTLAVSNNRLWKLPDELSTLTDLSTLYAHHNKLTDLPDFGSNLSYLDIGYNRFESLPPHIAELSELYELDISNNDLSEVPELLKKLENLQNLFVSDNPMEKEAKTADKFRQFVVDLELKGVVVR